eukprot:CAMPEP_0168371654 /NCGR_PEP_ID=MMETSP0228-20121227/7883_1 /TAXON_ID=133427 /ORGANISM="Protoceratium reticulatum, Strain CCCM 535 (=CCMP 1889)" /LENGTH=426 /DNA_ID=CAMNT_0008384549 /DNA_START=127 /DNA_END=1404 /DNA_ORIENTATION=+
MGEVEEPQMPNDTAEDRLIFEEPHMPEDDVLDGLTFSVTVAIMGATGLRSPVWAPVAGRPECCCVLGLGGEEVFKTRTVRDCLDPTWREEVELPDYMDGKPLEFSIFDVDMGRSFFLGRVSVASSTFLSDSGFHGDLKIEEAGEGADQAFLKLKIKVAGKDYPPAPPAEFRMSIDLLSWQSYGLKMDFHSFTNTLTVIEVRDGPFLAYNGGAMVAEQIRKLDFIMNVNGATSCLDMLEEFKTQSKVELLVRRPQEYLALIDCSVGRRHGLGFPKKCAGEFLVITRVGAGTVSDWNDSQPEEKQVKPGDRIVSVGGESMKASEIKAMIEHGGGLFQCLLIRPCSDDAMRWAESAARPAQRPALGLDLLGTEPCGGNASAGKRAGNSSDGRLRSDASRGCESHSPSGSPVRKVSEGYCEGNAFFGRTW